MTALDERAAQAFDVAVVEIADRLRQRTWRFGSGAGVSAGAATVTVRHGTTLTPARVFAAADRAQYVAEHGRLSSTVVAQHGVTLTRRG